MILNKHSYPRLYTDRTEYGGYTKLWELKNFNDHDYWFIDIQNNVSLLNVIPEDILNKIKSDDTYLLLSNSMESNTHFIDNIYKELIKILYIPANKIIIFSENKNASLEVIQKSLEYKEPVVQVYWSLAFEIGTRHQIFVNYQKIASVKTLEHKEYTKSFLNFNRRWRLHRPLMVALLYAKNLLDRGYVSIADGIDNIEGGLNWNNVFPLLESKIKDNYELHNLLVSNKDQIVSFQNMYLDTHRLEINRPRLVEDDIDFTLTKELYENSYFSLVSETNFFDDNSIFFTEKIFKPITFKHPFLLISSPNQLEHLRGIGYKTFHPFIDESYDTEPNDLNRLVLILNEVERLSKLSDNELKKFLEGVYPIVQHNFNVLASKSNFGHLYKIL